MNLIEFFEKIPKHENDIVFFDIDDTLLDPYTNKPIIPVLDFYKYLVKNGYNIAIITARANNELNYKYGSSIYGKTTTNRYKVIG